MGEDNGRQAIQSHYIWEDTGRQPYNPTISWKILAGRPYNPTIAGMILAGRPYNPTIAGKILAGRPYNPTIAGKMLAGRPYNPTISVHIRKPCLICLDTKSVFDIIGKSHYKNKKGRNVYVVPYCDRMQHYFCNIPGFLKTSKKLLKCNLQNMFCVSDERARKARKC